MSERADSSAAPTAGYDLSVIIVNYNVRYFLEQCLHAVRRASSDLDVETIVVDNDSTDDSLAMLRKYPEVTVIANRENVGFAQANNQAIRIARGRYVLLLNPDTLVGEDTFAHCLALAEADPAIGVIGVRMVDGQGLYLPESKRGLPTPWVSFAKMSGLGRLAPRSRRFNGYYLGHLRDDLIADVEVLPGAFMWLRPAALAAVGGGLDEDYFMYGEDIDLSYLIAEAGYRVVFDPTTEIIHYKGESTRKQSWQYVKAFYRAMAIFSRKHLQRPGWSPQPLLELAIYGRAFVAVLLNLIARAMPVLLDLGLLWFVLHAVKRWWASYYFGTADYYVATRFDTVNAPVYLLAWVVGLALSGAYDRPLKIWAVLRGVGLGTVLSLLAYALLPAAFHTSRAIIVLTALFGGAALGLLRIAWSGVRPRDVSLTRSHLGRERRLVVIGTAAEGARALMLLGRAGVPRQYLGRIASSDPNLADSDNDVDVLGQVADTHAIVGAYDIDEVVVGLETLPTSFVMALMQQLGRRIDYRTLAPGAEAIVGSPSRNTPGILYAIDGGFAIAESAERRAKRTLDIAVAVVILLLAPLAVLFISPLGVLRNAWGVLCGGLTWVGYGGRGSSTRPLPKLRPGVLPHGYFPGVDAIEASGQATPAFAKTDHDYARYWRLGEDWRLVRMQWRHLGRAPLAIPKVAPPRWPSHWVNLRVSAKP